MAEQAPSLRDIFTAKGNKYARRSKDSYTSQQEPARAAERARKTAANVDLAGAMAKDTGPFKMKQSAKMPGPGRTPSGPAKKMPPGAAMASDMPKAGAPAPRSKPAEPKAAAPMKKKMKPREDTWANLTRTGRSNGGLAAVTSGRK